MTWRWRDMLIGTGGLAGAAVFYLAVPAAAGGPGLMPAGAIKLPSGQVVTLLDVITNVPGPDGLAARFRFLAPAVARDGGTVDAEVAGKDMDWLCQNFALDRIADIGPQPGQIIISIADMDVPFGETHPEATQFFNAYDIADGACQWVMF